MVRWSSLFLCEAEMWKTTMGMIYTYILLYLDTYIQHTDDGMMMDVYSQRGPYVSKYFILHVHHRYVGLVQYISKYISTPKKSDILPCFRTSPTSSNSTSPPKVTSWDKWRSESSVWVLWLFGFMGPLHLKRRVANSKKNVPLANGICYNSIILDIFFLSHNYRELCHGWFQDVL